MSSELRRCDCPLAHDLCNCPVPDGRDPGWLATAGNIDGAASAASRGTGSMPLAGDLVAALAARIGADRAADWIARQVLGLPTCYCPERQAALNRLDAKVRRFLRWG